VANEQRAIVNVPIPPEFEAFAREQVAADATPLRRTLLPTRSGSPLTPRVVELERGEEHRFDAEDTKRHQAGRCADKVSPRRGIDPVLRSPAAR
jgi:hypothetical protein